MGLGEAPYRSTEPVCWADLELILDPKVFKVLRVFGPRRYLVPTRLEPGDPTPEGKFYDDDWFRFYGPALGTTFGTSHFEVHELCNSYKCRYRPEPCKWHPADCECSFGGCLTEIRYR